MSRPQISLKSFLAVIILGLLSIMAAFLYEESILSPICSHYAQAAGGKNAIFHSSVKSRQWTGQPRKPAHCSFWVYDTATQTSLEKEMLVSQPPFSVNEQFLFSLDPYTFLSVWVIGAVYFLWRMFRKPETASKRLKGKSQST